MRMKARVSFGFRRAGFDEVRRTLFPYGDVAQGIVVAYHLEELTVCLTEWVKVRGDVQGVIEDGAVVGQKIAPHFNCRDSIECGSDASAIQGPECMR